jgi:hypothetical protein
VVGRMTTMNTWREADALLAAEMGAGEEEGEG